MSNDVPKRWWRLRSPRCGRQIDCLRAAVVAGLVTASGCSEPADVVLLDGAIWTGTGAPGTALAVREGTIVAVGDARDMETLVGRGTERIPLDGRLVLPGLQDNHTHFITGGFSLAGVRLRDAATPAEFTGRIGSFAADRPGEWMLNGEWDHERWGGELPRREWIDSVTPDTPVFVSRLDGHMALANGEALARAGITADTPDPPGGEIVRDAAGAPTGVLKDAAMDLVFAVIPRPDAAGHDRALQAAAAHAVARGVTHVTDMGSWDGLETYRRAAAADRLPLRVYAAVPIATWQRLEEYSRREGRGDHRLAWGAVKGFVDGSLGSTTAWFYEPYRDAPETAGLMVTDTAQLRDRIIGAHRAGLHVIVHAIGDRANDWLLEVFAAARGASEPDPRFRIEHAQHLTPEAIQRFAAQGVIPSMQPYHAIDDGRWAEKRIGPDRIQTTYAFRSLLEAGARLTFGSDWTVAPLDPMLGIYAAVTRRTLDGANPDGWVPQERIGIEDAVAAYTRHNAFANFLDDVLGTIEVGKYADLVVLDRNILTVDPEEIRNARVDLTMVGGQIVYRR